MMSTNAFERKVATHKCIGPGGMNCPCCGPAPGKERKAFFRRAKRRAKMFWKKEVEKTPER